MTEPTPNPDADFFDREAPDPKKPKPKILTPLERYNANRAARSGYALPPLTQAQYDRRAELSAELEAGVTPERDLEIRIERAEQDGLKTGLNPAWVKLVAQGSLPKPKSAPVAPRTEIPATSAADPEEFERRRKASLAALDGSDRTG